jgi:HK97 family phage major capsid protein
MTLAEKLQKRGQLIQQMRAIRDAADKEKRSMTAEETANFDKYDTEQEALKGEIDQEKGEADRRSKLDELERSVTGTTDAGQRPTPGGGTGERRNTNVLESSEYRSAIDGYLRGDFGMSDVRAQIERRADTLQTGLFVKAGALVMPQLMSEGLIKAVDNETFMLQLATVDRITTAESLGVVTLETDPDDADWTAELKTGNQADLEVGKRALTPHPIAKRALVSATLLRRTAGGAESLVTGRLSYKFGVTFEKAGLTGDGVRKPLGIFTAHSDGIPTSRDVSTGNEATAMKPDGLINAKHSLKQAYWGRATWVFHRDGISQIRKMKDSNGQYLWAPGLSADLQDRILEVPYKVSEYAPNTFTASQYVGIIGAFKEGYRIVVALDQTIKRLDELYAETNRVGFIGRMEADGQPVLAEAFARVKLGA